MAYSKVRWIFTPTFLACVGGAYGRGEGVNGWGGGAHILGGRMHPSASRMRLSDKHMRSSGSRMRPLCRHMRPSNKRMRPSASRMRPQQPRPSNVAAMWQQCGSHRGQSKSRFTLSKVNKMLTLIRRTWTLLDVTDGRTDETNGRKYRQPCPQPHLHALRIKHHNKTVWEIHKLLLSSPLSCCLILMNAGSFNNKLPDSTVPSWFLPYICLTPRCQCNSRLRPDLLCVNGTPYLGNPPKSLYYDPIHRIYIYKWPISRR
jgi:hypothetical protein